MDDSFQIGRCTYTILCVPSLRFKEVEKEHGTRGNLYIVWAHNCFRQCFVAQSVPPIVKMIWEVCKLRLFCSSFYRVLRGQTKKPITRNFEILKVETVEELNEHLSRFEMLFCCSQDLNLWVVDETSLPSTVSASI